MSKRIISLIITISFLISISSTLFAKEEKPGRFCTMDTAIDRLLKVADIPEDLLQEDFVRFIAEGVIALRLAEEPDKKIKITWSDIYDMRGTLNAWYCLRGHKMSCVGQAIDAVGSGLLGTTVGKVVFKTGLVLTGPVGFIVIGAMNITEESFQCNPSAMVMAIEAGATATILIPWCSVPGISDACVSVSDGFGNGVKRALLSKFGKEISAKVLKTSSEGIIVVIGKVGKFLIKVGVNQISENYARTAYEETSKFGEISMGNRLPDFETDNFSELMPEPSRVEYQEPLEQF
ncbi:MAG: hypothetical protein KKD35_00200 [Elusimicrobia bacterium]|nr:hypothetical protein [Elusimicrobiota bacterium]